MTATNVIMPVFRGDGMWMRAMRSLAENRSLFDAIVVSFDGPERVRLAALLLECFGQSVDPVILVTPRVMSSTEHALWIVDQLPVKTWSTDDWVLYMAEDDVIRQPGLSAGLDAVRRHGHSILFGSWEVWEEEPGPDEAIFHADDVRLVEAPAIAGYLEGVAASGELTSVSGMTMRMSVLRNYFRQMEDHTNGRLLLRGFRTEYFLATQPGVRFLLRSPQPIFAIQEHPEQERVVTATRAMNHDEALYQLWLLITTQPMRATDRLKAGLRLCKRLVMDPSTARDLIAGYRTFWSTRRGLPS